MDDTARYLELLQAEAEGDADPTPPPPVKIKPRSSENLKPDLALFDVMPAAQPGCPLLTRLPAEVRQLVWEFTLSDFSDPSPESKYSLMTYYTRPTYEAPRKSDARLLRTCRAIYFETWTLPFLLREHTWWLTSPDRHPGEFRYSKAFKQMEASLEHAASATEQIQVRTQDVVATEEGEDMSMTDAYSAPANSQVVDMSSLKVFAQMYSVEDGDLHRLLRMRRLNPRRVTLTIRHADWWYWEDDRPLRFEAKWLEPVALSLSPSTNEFVFELETLERKKDQLDYIVSHICRKWFFKRRDGVVLYGDTTGKSNHVSRWQGCSIWDGQRWTRDESSPGKIDYYVVTVPFRPLSAVERRGGKISDELGRLEYKARRMRVSAPGTPLVEFGRVPHEPDDTIE